MLAAILDPHCDELIVASSFAELAGVVSPDQPPLFVLGRFDPSDERSVEALRALKSGSLRDGQLVLLTASDGEEEALAELDLESVSYLRSPFHLGKLKQALRSSEGLTPRARRASVAGLAVYIDPIDDGARISWHLVDVSATGAFLETSSPLPLGLHLGLSLLVGPARIHVSAEVVRVQQPEWGHTAGIGVRFLGLGASSRDALAALTDDSAGC
jgi:CheY-like chemotaxis protein